MTLSPLARKNARRRLSCWNVISSWMLQTMPSQKSKKQAPFARVRLTVGVAGLTLLSSCGHTAGSGDKSLAGPTESFEVTTNSTFENGGDPIDKLLEPSIQVGEDLYMLPKGIDEDGCEAFGAFSKTGPTIAAIQYRQADGGFGIAKDPKVCGVEMVALGKDKDGHEMYQAMPNNSSLEPTEVVYYQGAGGRYVPHKTKI